MGGRGTTDERSLQADRNMSRASRGKIDRFMEVLFDEGISTHSHTSPPDCAHHGCKSVYYNFPHIAAIPIHHHELGVAVEEGTAGSGFFKNIICTQ